MTISLFVDVIICFLLLATIIYAAMLNRRLMAFRSNRTEMETLIRTFSDACARAEAGTRSLRGATEEATRLQAYLERSQNLRDDLAYLMERGGSLADRLEGGVRVARGESSRMPAAPAASNGGLVDQVGERSRDRARPPASADAEEDMSAESAPRPSARERLRDRMRTTDVGDTGGDVAQPDRDPSARPARGDRTQDKLSERMAERVAERLAQRAGDRIAGPSVEGEGIPRPARDRSLLRAALAGNSAAGASDAADRATPDAVPRSKAERELLQALRGRR
jgi:hypothetical protein